MTAIWQEGPGIKQSYPELRGMLEVDDVIIGAGITGLTTALKLIEAGRKVAIVEAAKVADSSTGNSTGNLYSTLSGGLADVQAKWDNDSIRQLVAMRGEAVTFLEEITHRFSIDCQFKRVPLHWCISGNDKELTEKLQAEYKVSTVAGLQAQLVSGGCDLPVPVHLSLRIENQAQFNPFRFAQGLARVIKELGGLIFEGSPVRQIKPDEGLIETTHGQIRAGNIIQATHTPKGVNILQAEMQVYREYGIAAVLQDTAWPDGIYWLINDSQSVRTYTDDGKKFVIVVGSKHKTGKAEPDISYYERLNNYTNRHFGNLTLSYKWSAQQYKSADLLPYIGHSGHHNVFVATGFAADGLVWGTVAADIISHQILGKEHPGVSLFNPRRFTPLKSAKNWVKESSTVAKELFKSYLTPAKRAELTAIAAGDGQIVSVDGEKLAVYHSADKGLLALSSVCPHMKCRVVWNREESSWDCPCHGSRFNVDGEVIEGPACEPLQIHLLEEKRSNS